MRKQVRYESREIDHSFRDDVNAILSKLPKALNSSNKRRFSKAFNDIDRILRDKTNNDYLLIPFYLLGSSYENCYAKGFTWEAFMDEILDHDAVEVATNLTTSMFNGSSVNFTSEFNKKHDRKPDYIVSVVFYD